MTSNAVSLDDMALFVEIVRSGNFSRAGKRLALSNATLSRRIGAMEQRLGVRLFERNTRQLTPTDAARAHYERCAPLVDEAYLAHEALRHQSTATQGHIRASIPVDLGTILLGASLPQFLAAHPGITLDLDLSPRFVDLRTEPIDVAFRLGTGNNDGLVAQRIGTVAQALFAAPDYLRRHGRPRRLSDLSQHACLHIGSARRGGVWRFADAQGERTVNVRGPVGLNNMGLCVRLAEQGLGIALLPLHLVKTAREAGRLEPVLPSLNAPGWPLYAMTTSRLRSAAVRAFVDFVARQLIEAERPSTR